jgi:hypothetical protein
MPAPVPTHSLDDAACPDMNGVKQKIVLFWNPLNDRDPFAFLIGNCRLLHQYKQRAFIFVYIKRSKL